MYSLVIGILSIILPTVLSATKQLPVETNLLWERGYFYIAPCDFNKDSTDELITIESESNIQPKDQNLYSLIASRAVENGTFKFGDCECGGYDEKHMWATYKRKDSLFLYDVWPRRELLITTGFDITKSRGWDSYVKQVELFDINADGRLEAVIVVVTAWDRKPRGIFVLDWETGKLLWKFLCGPVVWSFSIKDIDGDGQFEILCGTHAIGNGNIDNEMVDWQSYVFILNSDGKVRWSRQVGVYSSVAKTQWLENEKTGTLHVLVSEQGSPAGGRECDSIFVFDALNGQTITKAQYGKFTGGLAIINDIKGLPMIIFGGSDDTLRILDENLKVIRKRFVNGDGCWDILAGHFTGRKKPEVIVSTTNGRLLLYDLRLRLLSQFPIGQIYNILAIKYQSKSRLLIYCKHENQVVWQLVGFNVVPFLSRRVKIATVIIGAIGFLLLFTIAMVYARYQRTRDIRLVIRGLTGKSGVIELNQKGDVVTISPRAREILKIEDKDIKQTIKQLFEIKQIHPIIEMAKSVISDSTLPSPQEAVISLSQEQSHLIRCIRVKKGVLITFEDISAVEYMKRVTSWTPVAQKLAHGIKNPLSTILGAVEQMEIKCQENGIKKYIGYVKDEVTKLKKMSDAFMRFTKSAPAILEPKNINEIIKKIMAKYEPLWERGVRSEKGGDIKVEYEMDEKLPLLNIDEEGISNALNIIIENAIESMSPSPLSSPVKGEEMKRSGILRIRTTTTERLEKEELKQYVGIEISDTGTGIPEKYLEKVFDPYFTYNKPLGTGLGLTLAKKIIEDHKGYIEINSKEGVGTQVNIYLPLK